MRIILENGVEIEVPREIAKIVINTIFDSDPEYTIPSTKVPKLKQINVSLPEGDSTARRSFTDAERDNIIEMRKRGFSVKEIAKKMQCKRAKMDQYVYNLKKKGLLDSAGKVESLEGL